MEFEEIKKIHDKLRSSFIRGLCKDGSYSYPESEDGSVSGRFTSEPDCNMLKRICEYAAEKGTTPFDGRWSAEQMYENLIKEMPRHNGDRYYISICYGGASIVLTLLTYLIAYSSITDLELDFTHDKWEARGDYSSGSRVGFKLSRGEVVVTTYKHEEYNNMF